jgi:hypothetical protein
MRDDEHYALTSTLATLYAMFFLVPVMAASVGDRHNVLRLPVWFCWQVLGVVVLVAELNPYPAMRLSARRLSRHAQLLAKLFMAGAFFMQDLTFFVLACVNWARKPLADNPFFGTAAAILFVGTALAALLIIAIMWGPLKRMR